MSLALYGLWALAVTLGFARVVALNQPAAARNPRDTDRLHLIAIVVALSVVTLIALPALIKILSV
ncbi:hypothetical protein [Streptomyces sp. NBC_01445]|uniref:hypothetical protein n=1 Tax=Streptomyces sp. NBC_01445 TaxID=2903869 RepID=UPI002DDC4186|nr:hypothetical protein [Streptomyces sp. NBC_01445]WSE02023.1 hypothetical protein OG574_00395 [Streptomyces sp. NBC_01445]WSE10307.1 hypothetical protein OG574_47615 [Streptomyces sp. NBC_01445]WSE11125.1 hypothetical protein OG574_48405 [Streptomyces sp. NBC_01445]